MPDGSHGLLAADHHHRRVRHAGIQLGFGFTLLGVGGLLGLNRTDEAARRSPRASAPARSRASCSRPTSSPTRRGSSATCARSSRRSEGTFLIGPMAKLGWGTPTLVSLSLGVIIEIPRQHRDPRRAQGRAARPRTRPLLVAAGQLHRRDRVRQAAALVLRALFDSRVAVHHARGRDGPARRAGATTRTSCSASAASTRVHAAAAAVPEPAADRVEHPQRRRSRGSASRATSRSPPTPCSSARAPSCSSASTRSASRGTSAFDALFQFSPFHFIIEISASLSVKVFGVGLFSVRLAATLEGPTPWRARATARSRCCSSTSTSTSTSPGARRATPTLPPIAVMPLLHGRARQARTNWTALLPPATSLLVSLRDARPATDATLVLHPVGTLQVSQRAVPLDLTLDKVGNQRPTDVERASRSPSPTAAWRSGDDAEEPFAPAQFQDLDDAEKLSPAGVRGRSTRASSWRRRRTTIATRARWSSGVVRYEQIIIDTNFQRSRARASSASRVALFAHFLARRRGRRARRCRRRGADQLAAVRRDRSRSAAATYAVASTRDNTAVRAETVRSPARRSAREFLTRRGRRATRRWPATLHVIPTLRDAGAHDRPDRHLLVPAVAAPGPRQPDRQPPTSTRTSRRAPRSTSSSQLTGDGLGGRRAVRSRRRARRALRPRRHRRPRPARDRRASSRATGSRTSSRTTSPTIEFYDEDFPWRYTPAAPGRRGGRLRPWLALVVLAEDEFARGRRPSRAGRCRTIDVTDAEPSFPPAGRAVGVGARARQPRAWRRATPSSSSTDMRRGARAAGAALAREPRPRLLAPLCPRRLAPNTAYHAFLVPAFETGRLAGLGLDPGRRRRTRPHVGVGAYPATGRATELPVLPPLVLPHRHARRLRVPRAAAEPRPVDSRVGVRDMDVQRPGREPARHRRRRRCDGVLQLGGALQVPRDALTPEQRAERTRTRTGTQPYPHPFQTRARRARSTWPTTTHVDGRRANAEPGRRRRRRADPDPLITPPLYGRWHALTQRLLTDARRHAAARPPTTGCTSSTSTRASASPAGFGTGVVQDQPGGVHGRRLGADRRRARGQPAHPARRSSPCRSRASGTPRIWRRQPAEPRARSLALTAPVQRA